MTNIISIATAVPDHCHKQDDILLFMQEVYQLDEIEKRKLKFQYHQSGIEQRFSVLPDFSIRKGSDSFFSRETKTKNPGLEDRLKIYDKESSDLSVKAIQDCIRGFIAPQDITHLITVSCTGMSAPGLDLQLAEKMGMRNDIFRTSVNFMGCYAAIHALKIADMIAKSNPEANIIIVAVELCTLHFQTDLSADNAASSLLFADGCAAVLISNTITVQKRIVVDSFFSRIATEGKSDMTWEIGSNGFQMRLSGYIPQLIEADIETLVTDVLEKAGIGKESVHQWCVHPGGKRILDAIERKLNLPTNALDFSRNVLKNYGNMSSPTILFVLKDMFENNYVSQDNMIGMAFGPGLTMETFTAHFK